MTFCSLPFMTCIFVQKHLCGCMCFRLFNTNGHALFISLNKRGSIMAIKRVGVSIVHRMRLREIQR